MQFKRLGLKEYAEPVVANELEEGSIYFSVTFADEDMEIPIVDTLVFIGQNLDENETGTLYFQDVESFTCGVRYGSADNEFYEFTANFFKCAENDTNNVFKFEQALDVLLRCSLRRNARKDRKDTVPKP